MNKSLFTECEGLQEKILKNELTQKLLEEVKRAAEVFEKKPIEALDFTTFNVFYETGNRVLYETKYFERRARLNVFSLMLFLYGDEKYKKHLEDSIWAICDEYTWALPAHFPISYTPEEAMSHIDLFSAETGFALCESLRIVGEKINPAVVVRAKTEIKRRIVNAYPNNSFKWDAEKNNWAAVCAGSVAGVYMYMEKREEFEKILPRILSTIDCYLDSLAGDGTCFEGYEYFKYGFGYFTYFSELLRQYTNGEINLFEKDAKIEKTAQFPQKVSLGYGKIVNFADSVCDCWHLPGLTSFLSAKYDSVNMLPSENFISFGEDTEYRFAHFIRDFVWSAYYKDKTHGQNNENKCCYFNESEMYVKTSSKYEFAAISGKNNVPHNHNDVGAFILRCQGEGIVEDLGKGLYCADYFNEKRYDFLATSSRGHSVPIIGGVYQKSGDEFCGKVLSADDTHFCFNMQDAYDCDNLISLTRRFDFSENEVTLSDKFLFEDAQDNLTERITTLIEPKVEDDEITVGEKKFIYDKTKWELKVSSEDYTTIYGDRKAYLIDFVLKELAKEAEFYITFIMQ